MSRQLRDGEFPRLCSDMRQKYKIPIDRDLSISFDTPEIIKEIEEDTYLVKIEKLRVYSNGPAYGTDLSDPVYSSVLEFDWEVDWLVEVEVDELSKTSFPGNPKWQVQRTLEIDHIRDKIGSNSGCISSLFPWFR